MMPWDAVERFTEVVEGESSLIEFAVLPPASLKVQALNSKGRPEASAAVYLKYREEGIYRAHTEGGAVDLKGGREFRRLSPGAYLVQVVAQGSLPNSTEVELMPGETQSVVLRLDGGGTTVAGRVVGGGGRRLPRVSGFLLRRGADARTTVPFWTVDWSKDGAFSAAGIPRGDYELNLLSELSDICVRFEVGEDQVDLGDIDIGDCLESGSLSIEVEAVADAPARMSVSLLYRNERWASRLWKRMRVKNTGSIATVGGLTPGTYRFAASPASLDGAVFDVIHATAVVDVSEGELASPPRVVIPIRRVR
jgi:hypothetical protein